MDEIYTEIKNFGKLKINESLAKHSSFKVGGTTKYFIEVSDLENFIELLKYLDKNNINYLVIGGGTNLLFSDDDFDGVIILNKCNKKSIDVDVIEVESGCSTAEISQFSLQNELSGFEWGIGVPGTIGGAVRGNAGLPTGEMKDNFLKALVYENGEVLEYDFDDCDFSYRHSIFKEKKAIILKVYLKLKKSVSKDIQKKTIDFLTKRSISQPQGYPSAGCSFKNVFIDEFEEEILDEIPQEFIENALVPAGWLIEKSGLKGFKIGGAQVSEKHANFILNKNDASALDIFKLIEEIKEKVYNKFRVNLKEEIQIINF